MKTIKPDYFEKFKCKANKCVDSCCSAGWQVDVDSKSLAKYCGLKDDFFADINNFIVLNNNSKTFKSQQGKCIFLKDGQCSLVTKFGDKYLCDVCRDYPRFYNYVSDVNLIGLSLDCEEVANLVLNNKNPVKFVTNNAKSKDAKLAKKLDLMFKIINILQDRTLDIKKRIANVLNIFSCKNIFIKNDIFSMFDKMEWLNFDGKKLAAFLNSKNFDFNFKYSDEVIENLLVYFVYRYFVSKTRVSELAIIKFAIFATWCCDKMQDFFDANCDTYYQFKNVTTFCRQIEYSAKNLDLLFEYFDKN